MSGRHAFGPRALKAPAEDGAVVSEPPLEALGRLLADNRRAWEAARPAVLGIPWEPLRQEAREEVLALARDYLSRRGEPVPPLPAEGARAPLLLAGHQPELFHPGVWVKNFALHGLAEAHRGVALNLVVDTDTVKSTSLRLPAPPGEGGYPRLLSLPFDLWAERPYEEKALADRDLFRSFADRAGAVLAGWGYEPLLPSFWEEVLRQAERTALVGECFAGARRTFERAWGCHNLEVPVSRLCGTRAFARFALHLLMHLPRFHGLYNAALRAYRQKHGIRSRNHPVPELAWDDGWREAPLWAWRGDAGRRGRLFARLTAGGIELRAGAEPWPTVPWEGDGTGAWQDLVGKGFKVRPRALATTLFARLFLGDLFLHGLGGGKYDELTDEIVRRFYGLEPPGFATLSATRLLPLPLYPSRPADRRRLLGERRDLHFNPQRHRGAVADDPEYRALLAERREWVERDPADRNGRRERFRAIRELNARLRAPLEGREQELTEELRRCEEELKANAVLRRRDYAFCLFPESLLRPFLTSFLCFSHE